MPLRVVVNGEQIKFPDALPFIDGSGRIQTPTRFIGEELGATVSWDQEGQKATFVLGDKKLTLYIGKREYELNGETKQMDTVALLKEGRTFVPARYVAEAFGATVNWDGAVRTVYVKTGVKIVPQPNLSQDEAEVILYGFKIRYSKSASSGRNVYITSSQFQVRRGSYDTLGSNYPLLSMLIIFDSIGSNYEQECIEVEQILRQKIKSETVDEAMRYIKTKTGRGNNELPLKKFSDGTYKIYINSGFNGPIGVKVYVEE